MTQDSGQRVVPPVQSHCQIKLVSEETQVQKSPVLGDQLTCDPVVTINKSLGEYASISSTFTCEKKDERCT